MSTPFRFGVQAAGAYTGADWRARARAIEALGYSSLLMPDHLDTQWGPLVALTVAAEATTDLRVGTLVLANDYRNPVVLAKEIATLDLISSGRVEFGLGAGWRAMDYRAAGLCLDPPAQRIDRLAESVRIVKDIWSTSAVDRAGRHYTVSSRFGHPRPVGTPHPPLLLGGGGKRMLTLAAREADIVGVNPPMTAGRVGAGAARSAGGAGFDERIEWVREAAGERWKELELQCLVVTCRITADARSAVEVYAAAAEMTAEEFAASPMTLIGDVDQICDQLCRRRERWGLSYVVIPERAAESFAPVVARMVGR